MKDYLITVYGQNGFSGSVIENTHRLNHVTGIYADAFVNGMKTALPNKKIHIEEIPEL
jgi:hypothetical protein